MWYTVIAIQVCAEVSGMKLEHMHEFLVLAEALNFSEAAKRLFISQSSLSKHVALLEDELATQLVQRTSHRVALTENGQEACGAFRHMLARYNTLTRIIEKRAAEISGTLVLGFLYYALDDFAGLIQTLRQRYPAIRMEFRTYQPHELYQDIFSGKVDIGAMPAASFPDANKLCVHKYGKGRCVAIMSKTHPLAARESVSLEELKNETLVELSDDFCGRAVTQELLMKNGVSFSNIVMTPTTESIAAPLIETLGVHITGANCRKQRNPQLCYIPISDKAFQADEAFLYLHENANPLVPIFIHEADAYYRHG